MACRVARGIGNDFGEDMVIELRRPKSIGLLPLPRPHLPWMRLWQKYTSLKLANKRELGITGLGHPPTYKLQDDISVANEQPGEFGCVSCCQI